MTHNNSLTLKCYILTTELEYNVIPMVVSCYTLLAYVMLQSHLFEEAGAGFDEPNSVNTRVYGKLWQLDEKVSYTIKYFIMTNDEGDSKAEGWERTEEGRPDRAPESPAASYDFQQ